MKRKKMNHVQLQYNSNIIDYKIVKNERITHTVWWGLELVQQIEKHFRYFQIWSLWWLMLQCRTPEWVDDRSCETCKIYLSCR